MSDPRWPCRKNPRLYGFDYSTEGAYVITICTPRRICCLGKVADDHVMLNHYGGVVQRCWLSLPERFPTIPIDEYIVMPNHMHGIVIIHGTEDNLDNSAIGKNIKRLVLNESITADHRISLGRIVAYFKYNSTKCVNKIRNSPGCKLWQRNFYDHVIRNEADLQRCREYIYNNPFRWNSDKYYRK